MKRSLIFHEKARGDDLQGQERYLDLCNKRTSSAAISFYDNCDLKLKADSCKRHTSAAKAEAYVVVLVIRVVVVPVARLQVVRAIVPTAATIHAVGAASMISSPSKALSCHFNSPEIPSFDRGILAN